MPRKPNNLSIAQWIYNEWLDGPQYDEDENKYEDEDALVNDWDDEFDEGAALDVYERN